MPTPAVAPRQRRARVFVGVLVALAVVAVLLLSHRFGRAEPTDNYRPPLPPDALATGCYPLPGGAELDLAHQVRRDGDVDGPEGPRRELRGQYDLVGRDEAMARMVEAFTSVGFAERGREDDGDTLSVSLADGATTVRISAADLPGTDAETLVRGEFVLDLPVVAPARPDDPLCSDPKSTKRWDPDQEPTR